MLTTKYAVNRTACDDATPPLAELVVAKALPNRTTAHARQSEWCWVVEVMAWGEGAIHSNSRGRGAE